MIKYNQLSLNMDSSFEFHHIKMTFMAELDNQIRYYRGGVVRISDDEIPSVKQYITYMTTCKKLDMKMIDFEKNKLKSMIGNMLYEKLEDGNLTQEFSTIWTNIIQHVNMYYYKCYLIYDLMEGNMDQEEYKESRNRIEMCEYTPEKIEIMIGP